MRPRAILQGNRHKHRVVTRWLPVLRQAKLAVVVAMTFVRVMQVVSRQVIHMIAVRNGLVAAVGAVNVALLVLAALVLGRAAIGIGGAYFDRVFVDGRAMHVMQMTVV